MLPSSPLPDRAFWLLGLPLLALLFAADVALGSVRVGWRDLLDVLAGHQTDTPAAQIILHIRLPKAFVAMLAGAGLSVAGLQMQSLFRNPLAGPSVLGISAGSTLGVAVVVLLLGHAGGIGLLRQLGIGGQWLLAGFAIAGALAVLALVMAIAARLRHPATLLIVGLMVGNMTMAVVSIWQYFSAPEQLKDFLLWSMGSLSGIYGERLQVLAWVVGLGLLLSAGLGKSLNVLQLGEQYAQSMGLSVRRARLLAIGASGILAGGITGFCGPIAFVGIAVPHLCRLLLRTADYQRLMPACLLAGACLLLACDVLAHLPGHQSVLPINAVTSLLGAPVVVAIALSRRVQDPAP
jgi:iron complex transport system permease protein